MYKELITALRLMQDWDAMDFKDAISYAIEIIGEAADAIEELSKRHECPYWYGDMRFCSLLGKTLPEPKEEKE